MPTPKKYKIVFAGTSLCVYMLHPRSSPVLVFMCRYQAWKKTCFQTRFVQLAFGPLQCQPHSCHIGTQA